MIQSRYKQGDVVLVRFVYTDETGAKNRPTLILSSDEYHQSRQEVIVAAITSNVQRILAGDHLIEGWQKAGLLYPSVVTGIIRTIKQAMIERRLGEMPTIDMQAIQGEIRLILGI